MKPGDKITNQYGVFEEVESFERCSGCHFENEDVDVCISVTENHEYDCKNVIFKKLEEPTSIGNVHQSPEMLNK